MKKTRVYRFNLIEIMLAIVIIALGMTSVFVLFPAGLSNHRTAMAENSIADIAELVISRVRAENALSVTDDGFSSDVATKFPERSELFNESNQQGYPQTGHTKHSGQYHRPYSGNGGYCRSRSS